MILFAWKYVQETQHCKLACFIKVFNKSKGSIEHVPGQRFIEHIGPTILVTKEEFTNKFQSTIEQQRSSKFIIADDGLNKANHNTSTNFSTMKTPKVNDDKNKDVRSTERSKFSQFYSQYESSGLKAKEKEEINLKKIENNLLEEYDFYLKKKTNQNFTAEILMQNRINETLEHLK